MTPKAPEQTKKKIIIVIEGADIRVEFKSDGLPILPGELKRVQRFLPIAYTQNRQRLRLEAYTNVPTTTHQGA